MTTQRVVILVALVVMCAALLAAPSQAAGRAALSAGAQQSDEPSCFPETGFCISGRIRSFWEQNGGLAVFGYPTGSEGPERVEGRTLQVQPFKRHRLELHPGNPFPYDVLLGRLGAEQMAGLRIASLPEQGQGRLSLLSRDRAPRLRPVRRGLAGQRAGV